MKAAFRAHYGGPEVLTLRDLPIPQPKAREVLVKVHYTTVNRTDIGVLTAKPAIMRLFTGLVNPRNPVTGTDFVGEVVETGSAVTEFRPGDRVLGFNDNGAASHAEFVCFSADKAFRKVPNGQSWEEAAASIEAAHYAYHFLSSVPIQPGQQVMLNGGTGAIGSAAIQFLKAEGVTVTAVCATPHLETVRQLGADRVIDYLKEDFTRDPGQYDFVLDAVGKRSFGACKHLLKPKGAYLSSELGPRNENPFLALWTPLTGGKKVVFPIPLDIKASLSYIADLVERGRFRPLIDRVYQPEDIQEAFRYVASGEKIGNVLVKWSE